MPNPNITPNTGGQISLPSAIQWTTNFRNQNPTAVKAHFFGNVIINEILNQPGCIGLRLYNAIDDNNQPQILLVGVDNNNNDMTNGIIADMSQPCPTQCSGNNVLWM
ncbi:MAG: hypothetical protein PSX81_10670 [bacterium]|nr:hypothetical protein [bacterium]